jgi:hypothetical protein
LSSDNYASVADYVMMYDEAKKVVPNETNSFEDKANEILTFLKLRDYEFNLEHLLEYLTAEQDESDLECEIEREDYEVLRDKLKDLGAKLNVITDAFKKVSNIDLYPCFSKTDGHFYFAMRYDDVVVLTPSALKLRGIGVNFGFQHWVEDYYD